VVAASVSHTQVYDIIILQDLHFLHHLHHLQPGKRTSGIEVVTSRVVDAVDELAHVRCEMIFGRHFGRGGNGRFSANTECFNKTICY